MTEHQLCISETQCCPRVLHWRGQSHRHHHTGKRTKTGSLALADGDWIQMRPVRISCPLVKNQQLRNIRIVFKVNGNPTRSPVEEAGSTVLQRVGQKALVMRTKKAWRRGSRGSGEKLRRSKQLLKARRHTTNKAPSQKQRLTMMG